MPARRVGALPRRPARRQPPGGRRRFVLGGHVGDQPVDEAAFRAGYRPVEVDPVRMAHYRHARVVDDLAEFADGVLDPAAPDAGRRDDLDWIGRFLAPGGGVALALADTAADGAKGQTAAVSGGL